MSDGARASALPRSTPSAEAVAAGGIRSFVDSLEAGELIEPHSVLVLRHGRVVAEGWWAPYTPELPHLLYSLSKSFTSTALAFAVDEGLVDLDDTVLSCFPELDGPDVGERNRRIRIRDVAAMASGHDRDLMDFAAGSDPAELVRLLLTVPPAAAPGTLFAYNQACTYAIAAVIQQRAGTTLTEYLRPRVLDPLGIGETGWLRDRHGLELGFSGLHATTEAIAKLGQLYLDGGAWNGVQLLPDGWVELATRAHIDNPDQENPDWRQGYGFQFWMQRHGYRGDGAYGQFSIVLPDQDMVVAVTSQSLDMQGVLDAAWDHLLPAVDTPSSDDADAALATFLSTRALPPLSSAEAPSEGAPRDSAEPRVFAAAPGNDQPSLTAVTLMREGDDWALELDDAGERLSVDLGIGRWAVTAAIAATGGRAPDGALIADVVLLETPHRLRLVCRTDGTFTAAWATPPLHHLPLRKMRMPRDS